jgi:hypothetical protein
VYVSLRFSRALCHHNLVLNPMVNTSQALALKHSTLLSKTKQQQVHHVPKSKSSATSAPQSPVPSDPNLDTSPSLRVGLHIHRTENGIAARVNNVHTFLEMNRHVRFLIRIIVFQLFVLSSWRRRLTPFRRIPTNGPSSTRSPRFQAIQ